MQSEIAEIRREVEDILEEHKITDDIEEKYDVERFWYDVQRDGCCIIESSIW